MTSSRRIPGLLVALASSVLLALAACGGGTAESDAAPERIESAAFGVAIEALPAGFTVARNDGQALVLDAVGMPGRIEAGLGPRVSGVNLIEELKQHQADIEARAGGRYSGQSELIAQLGRVYVSRGRFLADDGIETEEYKAIGIHPSGERALYLIYRYPAGDDSPARGQALIELVGELVPAGDGAAAATDG